MYQFILPGQQLNINDLLQGQSTQINNLILHKDLNEKNKQITSKLAGQLQLKINKDQLIIGITQNPLKYFCEKDDQVIGRIKRKLGDYYLVDLGSNQEALLGIYEFEGATKKNRPNLNENSLIYTKILQTSLHLRAKLTCKSKQQKKEWVTGEAYYGELKDGILLNTNVYTAKYLEKNGDILFQQIGQLTKFEICIGVNGKIWIKSQIINDTIVIFNIIKYLDTNGFATIGNIVNDYKGFFAINQQV